MSNTSPYFKRQKIIDELIEELLIEGSKRPSKIKALLKYGSKQDRYGLLEELVEDRVLKRKRINRRNVEYSMPADRNLQKLAKRIKLAQQLHQEMLDEIPSLKIPNLPSIFLFQLASILEGLMAVAYYEIYRPKTRQILVHLIYKEIDRMLDTLEVMTKNNRDATGQALKLTLQILTKKAEEFNAAADSQKY